MFKPMRAFNIATLTKRLNNFLYLPLAMNSKDLSNTTSDLVNLMLDTTQQQFLPKLNYSTDFEEFQNSILKNFNQGMEKVKENDWYKQISENWTHILKDFHVFWNGMRASRQMDKVNIATKKVLRKILEKYSVKENFYFQITKVLAKKIREGYQKFIVAHQALEMMEKHGLDVISEEIIKAYEEFTKIDESDENTYTEVLNVTLSKILDLNLSLMLIYHKLEKKPELTLQEYFDKEIIENI